jgi:stearoyl-CoA desaturase (delta-9 desaturase)
MLINSLAHVWGSRRYATGDDSRNNGLLAILTFGEGWHNNHHHYMSSVRQGFLWWEIDVSYYVLRALARVGLVWGLREPPASALQSVGGSAGDAACREGEPDDAPREAAYLPAAVVHASSRVIP